MEKQKAAKITSGVVGRIGKNAPIIPKAKLKKPQRTNNLLFNSSFNAPPTFSQAPELFPLGKKELSHW